MTPTETTRMISPKRILVVDDEPPVADTIKMILTMSGHLVDTAESVEQALRLFEAVKYDLIFTDYALGKLTGLDLARVIKGQSPNLPIVLITGFAEALELREGRLAHTDLMMGKPFSLEEMHAALAKFFPFDEADPSNSKELAS